MTTNLFVNLPIKNLEKTVNFFTELGFEFNPKFTDETSTCMIISNSIFAMLIEEDKFKTFTTKDICDSKNKTEVLLALQVENREEVDDLVKKAIAAGGSKHMPAQDHGFMYAHSFQDIDGHIWEVFYMESEK